MSKPTGRPRGRPKGSANKLSWLAREQAKRRGELPHEFLLRVSWGGVIDGHEVTFEERMKAANSAAEFFQPKLSHTEFSPAGEGTLDRRMESARDRLAGKLSSLRSRKSG